MLNVNQGRGFFGMPGSLDRNRYMTQEKNDAENNRLLAENKEEDAEEDQEGVVLTHTPESYAFLTKHIALQSYRLETKELYHEVRKDMLAHFAKQKTQLT